MGSTWGRNLGLSLFGESHGPAIGIVMDGLPHGFPLDRARIAQFMARRAPGQANWTTPRRETDQVEILSGYYRDRTTGAPLAAVIRNADTRSADYDALRRLPRPGHADLTAAWRFGGYEDPRGSGHFSGRLTAPLVFAGAVASQILAACGVRCYAHAAAIAGIADEPFDPLAGRDDPDGGKARRKRMAALGAAPFPALNEKAAEAMIAAVEAAKADEDSVGGEIEALIEGFPAGIGDPFFDNLESRLAALLFAVPAIRGVSFGDGFAATAMRGSAHNDAPATCVAPAIRDVAATRIEPAIRGVSAICDATPAKSAAASRRSGEADRLRDAVISPGDSAVSHAGLTYATNHCGGIIGGISNGMPILFRVAVKPASSIGKTQQTVDRLTCEPAQVRVAGRHDPCIVPRAVPVIEAVAAVFALDALLDSGNRRYLTPPLEGGHPHG